MTRLDFLNSIHNISETEFDALRSNLRSLSFKKGESIISHGQVQKHLYFVKNGVQMVHLERDGKTHVIAFTYHPNLCAIPDSFYQQKPSKYNYTATTESVLEYLTFSEMEKLFGAYPNIETLFRKINERLLSNMLNLHIELRTMSIEERFTTFCRRSPHLLQQVPHKFIASYLGIDATNFSKLFNSVKI